MTPEPASTKTISAPDGTTHTLTLAEYAAFRQDLESQPETKTF